MLSEKAAVHLECTEIRYREKHSLFLLESKKRSAWIVLLSFLICAFRKGECLNLESALCMQMKLHVRSSFCCFASRRILFLLCGLLLLGSRNGGKYVTDS